MSEHEFHNALRVLRSIDAWELREAGVKPALIAGFLDWPHDCFIRMGDEDRKAVWSIVEKRAPARIDTAKLLGLLGECAEFLDKHSDVRDGQDGPIPNEAMALLQEVNAALQRAGR